ncbi:MAG: VTT domain-containing protein [bacterium]
MIAFLKNRERYGNRSFHIGAEELFLIIGLLLVILAVGVFLANPSLTLSLERWSESWQNIAIEYGYLGAFISAVVGNMSLFSPLPYTVVIFFLAAVGLSPILLALLMAIGAELGELTGYVIGRGSSRLFAEKKPKSYNAVRQLIDRRPKLIPLLLFIFGVLPLPDDVLFVPLGMVKYSLWKLLIPTTIGKFIAGLVIAYSGSYAYDFFFKAELKNSGVLINGFFVAIVIVGIYVFLKIPWERALEKISKDSSSREKTQI